MKPTDYIILDPDYATYCYAPIDDDKFIVRMWNEHESFFDTVVVSSYLYGPHAGKFWE